MKNLLYKLSGLAAFDAETSSTLHPGCSGDKYHTRLKRDGEPYYHARFKSAEDFWQWWLTAKSPDYMRGDCQATNLMANPDVSDAIIEPST